MLTIKIQDVENGKYRVVTLSPELLNQPACTELMKNSKFASRILYFVYDEAHCIKQWASFRHDYLEGGTLRGILPRTVSIYIASATLPSHLRRDVSRILRLRSDETENILGSNDRHNIDYIVRPFEHPVHSFHDLTFLIPDNFKVGDPAPPKFLVFFDKKKTAEDFVQYLRQRLPPELRDKVHWFHSTMTDNYRDDKFKSFKDDNLFGLACSDVFGMVSCFVCRSFNPLTE